MTSASGTAHTVLYCKHTHTHKQSITHSSTHISATHVPSDYARESQQLSPTHQTLQRSMVNLFSVSFSHYILTMVSDYVFTATVCHCGFVPIIRLYWFHVYFFIYIKCTVSLTYCTDTYLWNCIWKVLMSCVTSSLTLQHKRCALLVIWSFWETERWIVYKFKLGSLDLVSRL